MADTDKLRDLLHEMERARSPLQRLRLVALAWRTVRGLSPREREDIALKVGMAEAGELVERLAARDGGVAPTELLEAIHAAETTDPRRLRQLIGDLRGVITDPEQRRGLLHRAAEALDAAAAHAVTPAAAAGTAPSAEALTPPEGLPLATPPEPTPAAAAPPRPEPVPRPGPATSLPPRTPRAPSSPARLARPSAPAPPRDVPSAAPSPPHPPAPHRLVTEPPRPPTPPGDAPSRAPRQGLVERLASLRRRAGLLRGEGLERLRQEVAVLPPGWPRRRALCALLEEGLPVTTDAALALVGDLDGERDRAWCLATLVRARAVSGPQLEAALELVASPALRQRLRRLAATGTADE